MKMLWFTGCLYLVLTSVTAMASDSNILDLAKKVTQEKGELQKKEQEKRGLLSELYRVNKNLKKIDGEKGKIERNLKTAEENVFALSRTIGKMTNKIKTQRERLRERMKSLSKVQGQTIARVIFGSQTSSELDLNLRLYRIVTEKDYRLLQYYKQSVRIYKAQKGKLHEQEKKYSSLKRRLDEKEKHLAEQVEKKSQMVKLIDQSRIFHMSELKQLRLQKDLAAVNEVEINKLKAMEDLFKPQFFERKGQLLAPVEGTIAKSYGLYDDDQSGTKIRFKGQLFKSKRGAPVHTIYDGTVVFADWIDGYGKTVIVDHGDQYFSVYANHIALEVVVGNRVKQGAVIGFASDSPSFLGQGFYFELRHFSEPEDPKQWIKGS